MLQAERSFSPSDEPVKLRAQKGTKNEDKTTRYVCHWHCDDCLFAVVVAGERTNLRQSSRKQKKGRMTMNNEHKWGLGAVGIMILVFLWAASAVHKQAREDCKAFGPNDEMCLQHAPGRNVP